MVNDENWLTRVFDFIGETLGNPPTPHPDHPKPAGPDVNHFSNDWTGGQYSGGRQIKFDRRVRVVKEDGTEVGVYPVYGYVADWPRIKDFYGAEKYVVEGEVGALIETMTVPEKDSFISDVTLSKKKPMGCLFDSVKSYCSSILGVNLDGDDRTFFDDHPLTQDDGVPMPDTLRVAQELIGPYGLIISRVQAKPNYGVKGDLMQWRKVLGCNPLGYADRITSNNEFIEKMGLQGKEDPSKYRFEYSDVALYPSIACGIMSGADITTGSTGGHATYISPRRRVNSAMLSFQIERAAGNPLWKTPPVFAPFPESKLKVVTCFDLEDWYQKLWLKRDSTGRSDSDSSDKGVTGTVYALTSGKPKCWMCSRKDKDRKHSLEIAGLCDNCINLMLAEHCCGTDTCETTQAYPHLKFEAYHLKTQKIWIGCPVCHKKYFIDEAVAKSRKKTGRGATARALAALREYCKDNKLKVYAKEPSPTLASKDNGSKPADDTVYYD